MRYPLLVFLGILYKIVVNIGRELLEMCEFYGTMECESQSMISMATSRHLELKLWRWNLSGSLFILELAFSCQGWSLVL